MGTLANSEEQDEKQNNAVYIRVYINRNVPSVRFVDHRQTVQNEI